MTAQASALKETWTMPINIYAADAGLLNVPPVVYAIVAGACVIAVIALIETGTPTKPRSLKTLAWIAVALVVATIAVVAFATSSAEPAAHPPTHTTEGDLHGQHRSDP